METIDKKEFKEFIDYVFLQEDEDFRNFSAILYLKVLGKDDEYLGSTRIGVLKVFSKEETEFLIKEVLSLNYQLYEKYTIIQQ
mgnify:CR=1 FL=1